MPLYLSSATVSLPTTTVYYYCLLLLRTAPASPLQVSLCLIAPPLNPMVVSPSGPIVGAIQSPHIVFQVVLITLGVVLIVVIITLGVGFLAVLITLGVLLLAVVATVECNALHCPLTPMLVSPSAPAPDSARLTP